MWTVGFTFGLYVLCNVHCLTVDLLVCMFWSRFRCCCASTLSTPGFVIRVQVKYLPTYSKTLELSKRTNVSICLVSYCPTSLLL